MVEGKNEHDVRSKEGQVDNEIKDFFKNDGNTGIFASDGVFPHGQNAYPLKQVVNYLS